MSARSIVARAPGLGVVLALLLACGGARAAGPDERSQLAEPRWESVGDTASISDGVVSTVVVDRAGFLWIGTAIGLVRYDGYEFTPIQAPRTGQTGNAGFVRSLLPARDGRIWVGTDSDGLSVYDPETGLWKFYRAGPAKSEAFARGTVRSLVEDREGGIWVGTVGGALLRVDPGSGRVIRYGTEQGLPDERIQTLLVDAEGTVWAGTWNGLARLPRGQDRFLRPEQPEGLAMPDQVVTLLMQDALGRIWLGTQRGRLLRFNPKTQGLESLDEGQGPAGPVQALVEMDDDETWVARANGLELRRSGDGKLLKLLRHSLRKPWGPAGSDVRVLVKDRSGVLWMGSYGGGLQRLTTGTQAFWVRHGEADEDSVLGVVDIRSLLELPNGEIWAGTNDRGIAVLDQNLLLKGALSPGQGGYKGGRVGGIARSQDGRVWAAADDHVDVFDPERRQWLARYALGKGRVRIMLGSSDGAVYAGTQDGLYRWRPGESGFARLGLGGGQVLKADVNALVESSDGRVWVGGELGLFMLEAGASIVQPVTGAKGAGLGSDVVLGLLVDRGQHLWVDTPVGLHKLLSWDGQLARFEFVSERLHQGGKAFGANLLEDRGGRIWTHRSLYDPTQQQLSDLTMADGVDIGTGWFRAYVGLRDGRMLFGGSRGLLVLDPTRYVPWRFQPPVMATELHINGKDQPLTRLRPELRLTHAEGNFSLRFAALDLSQPGRNRYRYRLEGGSESEWIEVSAAERQASFGGLAPGHYELQVQGSNRNGDWSPHLLKVPIEMLPAWWQTWWARGGGLALLAAVIFLSERQRMRRSSQRQAELEARVAERTEALAQLSQALHEKSLALEESALTDPLTGLRNRRFVTQRLDDDLSLALRHHEEAMRRGEPAPNDAGLCFFMIDLDHFKQVNDQHGHAAGDAVLVQMKERLQEVFRETDYLVRWGGEEFLVVARGSARSGAPILAERARRAVAERPFALPQGRTLARTCSIGFAYFPLVPTQPRASGWALAVDLADAALYRAKREGRNRWVGVLSGAPGTLTQLPQDLGGQLPEGVELVRGPSLPTQDAS